METQRQRRRNGSQDTKKKKEKGLCMETLKDKQGKREIKTL